MKNAKTTYWKPKEN